MDFGHYHTNDEVNAFLIQWAKEYPQLVDLYSVGKSFEGRDIMQITVTNKNTGKDTDKPAMFIEGNRHSGEVTAAESALWFARHVLTNYGKDPEITRMVDSTTLYIKPKNNPDGSDLYLLTAQSNRSTVRPYDDDGDGLLDEDPAEDLDGDGFILQMRRKVEPGKGTMMMDPDDKSGRLMKNGGEGWGAYPPRCRQRRRRPHQRGRHRRAGSSPQLCRIGGPCPASFHRPRLHSRRGWRVSPLRDRNQGGGALPARTPQCFHRPDHGYLRAHASAWALDPPDGDRCFRRT